MIVDYSDLTVTCYFPTASECRQITEAVNEQRHELAAVDEEITALDEKLNQRRAYRTKLWRSYQSASGLTAPIRKLSFEILTAIFAYSIPGIDWREVERGKKQFWGKKRHPQVARATIQRVCRQWSTLVAETPRLWTTIAITDSWGKIEQLENAFHRSKSCLLDVYIGEDAPDEYLKLAMLLIEHHVSRLRMFCVMEFPDCLLDSPPLDSLTELPNLQYLCSYNRLFNPTSSVRRLHVPNLSSLSVHGVDMPSFTDSFHGLRRLVLNAGASYSLGHLPSYLDIFHACPSLQFLDWCDLRDYPDSGVGLTDMSNINLLFLTVLRIGMTDSEIAGCMLRRLCAPSLKTIHVNSDGGKIQGDTTLHLLLQLKAPELSKISLGSVHFRMEDEMSGLLDHFPSLATLCLEECVLGPAFFPATREGDNTPCAYPRLRTIHLCSTKFSPSNLAGFLPPHYAPDAMERRVSSKGLKRVLIEQDASTDFTKEQTQELSCLQETYDIFLITPTRYPLVHSCSWKFRQAKRRQKRVDNQGP